MITFDEMKNKINEYGYYAEEELLYEAYNALLLFDSTSTSAGQDIYAACLEGPPGAGKTEFAKVFTKLANFIFGDTYMVEYQCDATTGKNELFEDINISAAIRHDADNVNIPGKLVDAIKKVNEGKKIVLFLDEYDKAREETDAFLLQFLQSGKLNATQFGDMEIKEEYKHNLEVILCKNDMREELSGPLARRLRIIRLDYMKPNVFYNVATNTLITKSNNPINSSLINLVSLMYELAYNERNIFNRLPSCSEMMLACLDANRLIVTANAPQSIIYNKLAKTLFKNIDDLATFESILDKNEKLKEVINKMKENKTMGANNETINDLISNNLFKAELNLVQTKKEALQNLINEYKIKFREMEENRKKLIAEELKRIKLEIGEVVPSNDNDAIKLFEDESLYIKRGVNVFSTSSDDWYEVCTFTISGLSHHNFMEKIVKDACKENYIIYENGIELINAPSLIVTCFLDDKKNLNYKFYASSLVIPSTYLKLIEKFAMMGIDALNGIECTGNLNIDTLIYNEQNINFTSIDDNVYNIKLELNLSNDLLDFSNINKDLKCSDNNLVIDASKKILDSKKKVLTRE